MTRYIFSIDDPALPEESALRPLLGGKGAGLAEMVRLGLPVPPAFVISTLAFQRWQEDHDLAFLDAELAGQIHDLERKLHRWLGDPAAPLIVSVRSGAAISMPGMMDTILNIGLNEATAGALAKAWTPAVAQAALARLQESFAATVGVPAPAEPAAQIGLAIEAVFRSWDSARAKTYRARNGIPDDIGTAATVQAMVFGTAPGFSGTGVVFTRHPSTGHPEPMGDWLPHAQGEDVVAGTHATQPLEKLAEFSPVLWDELLKIIAVLEAHQKDMCDIEFTIESGKLWILQYRRGKRSPRAAVRIAVDLASDPVFGLTQDAAVMRVSLDDLATLLAERSAGLRAEPAATGLGASPGMASGKACFSVDAALDALDTGEKVILVRPETSPDDIPGMDVAVGILTSTGGMVSHAAIVAREWRKPAVVGVSSMTFADDTAFLNGAPLHEGDLLTIDGSTGQVFFGEIDTVAVAPDPALDQLIQWASEITGVPASEPEAALRRAHAQKGQ